MAIVEVVKYNGNPDVFAWKYPDEELGTWTQLIVNESQEAILFKGGQALDSFSAGRHTLETANIPLLNRVINLPFGGRSPFIAEIWYINKIVSLDVKWGTPTPIQLQDPKYKIFISLRSFGQFGIQIEDSRKFLTKLVGTLPVFDKDNLTRFFRGIYLTKARDAISSYLVHKKVSVLEINAYLDELSEHIKEKIAPIMSEYGIKLVNFYVNDINIPEDDSGVSKLKDALAKRAEMDIVGYNYAQERSFDTLEGAATNPGSAQSGLIGAGIGLGMGAGMGGAIGSQFGGIAENINITAKTKSCPNCDATLKIEKQFCGRCGYNFENSIDKEQITCSNCNYKYDKSVKFCPECGDPYNPCPECKADVNMGADNCHKCGTSMPRPCSNCGTSIKGKNKFCPECGIGLVKRCSSCNFEIEGSPKFCPECGNKM